MSANRSPWRAVRSSAVLRREAAALATYRLAEFGPWVAVLVYAFSRGGATATGLASLGLLVPTALCTPFAGPLIDRFGAGRVLFGAYVGQAMALSGTAASLLFGAPATLSYVLAAAAATVLAVTHPAHAVLSPAIARTTEELIALNALTNWILSIGLVVAPAGAGWILSVWSPGGVYAVGAGCVTVSALAVAGLRELAPPLATDPGDHHVSALRQVGQGARALSRSSAPREVVLVIGATFLVIGAFDVVAVTLAVGTLNIGESGAGYLTAAHGVGAVVGAFAAQAYVGRRRLVPVMLVAAAVAGAALIGLSAALTVGLAFAVAALTGLARSVLDVSTRTMLQRVTSTELLARVFATQEGLSLAAWGVGSACVPAVIALAGIRGALVFAGAILPVAVLLRLRPLLAADDAASIPTVRIALLRSLPIFRSLPIAALEGLAHTAHDLEVGAGGTVVAEGEVGDRYFAIVDGTARVTQAGRELRTMRRGEGFGEIALLHDVPRTATVAAASDLQLCVIERDPFLVALTGHAPSRAHAEQLAARWAGPVAPD